MTDTPKNRLERIEALPEIRRLFEGISKQKGFTAEDARKAFSGVRKGIGVKDTPESVRKLASIFDSEGCDAEANILRRYAYLLEQIKKAPRALIVNDFAVSAIPFGYSNDEKMQLLEGQRVALVQIPEK